MTLSPQKILACGGASDTQQKLFIDSKVERKTIKASPQKPSRTDSTAKRRHNLKDKKQVVLSKTCSQGFLRLREATTMGT